MKSEHIVYGLLFLLCLGFGAVNAVTIAQQKGNTESITDRINFTTEFLSNSDWQCVAQSCAEWVYGDDWVTDNCRPDVANNTLRCNVLLDNGQNYDLPIEMINISNVKSCREYECLTEVIVRGSKGEQK